MSLCYTLCLTNVTDIIYFIVIDYIKITVRKILRITCKFWVIKAFFAIIAACIRIHTIRHINWGNETSLSTNGMYSTARFMNNSLCTMITKNLLTLSIQIDSCLL